MTSLWQELLERTSRLKVGAPATDREEILRTIVEAQSFKLWLNEHWDRIGQDLLYRVENATRSILPPGHFTLMAKSLSGPTVYFLVTAVSTYGDVKSRLAIELKVPAAQIDLEINLFVQFTNNTMRRYPIRPHNTTTLSVLPPLTVRNGLIVTKSPITNIWYTLIPPDELNQVK